MRRRYTWRWQRIYPDITRINLVISLQKIDNNLSIPHSIPILLRAKLIHFEDLFQVTNCVTDHRLSLSLRFAFLSNLPLEI